MKILFIGFAYSVHVLRWLEQIEEQGWDIHLFPSIDSNYVLPEFRDIIVHHSIYADQLDLDKSVKTRGFRIGIPFWHNSQFTKYFYAVARWLTVYRRRVNPDYRVDDLERTIKRIKPDIVHSIEFQHGGYLALAVKQKMGDEFPTWIATNYGSDVYLFGRLAEHQERVKAILELCDYYDCECERDVKIAQELGLQAKVIRPILPNAGGFDLQQLNDLPQITPVSERKQIIIKGYQHFAGRSLVALQVLRRCADLLDGYRIVIYSASPDVKIAAELTAQDTGLAIECLPHSPHETVLCEFGKSRIYMGLSISDAISTSMLEAMAMGAFPIQSHTACVDEWAEDGKTVLIVPPEDVDIIASALRTALKNDNLVNTAAEQNRQTINDRLDRENLKPVIVKMYEQIKG